MNKVLLIFISWSISSFLWGVQGVKAQPYYVDNDVFISGDGASFATAFKTLQEALDVVSVGEEIRIAGGTYYPNKPIIPSSTNNREVSFLINKDIIITGSVDPTTDIQDYQNQQTILSGDIDLDGTSAGNAYHVMVTMDLTSAAIFSGLHIQQGNANLAANINVAGITVKHNFGGGLYNAGAGGGRRTSPILINCIFTDCSASNQGGAFYAERSNSEVYNSLFVNNSTNNIGGAVQVVLCQIKFANCTFFNNSAVNAGGAIGRFGGNLFLYNNAFWNNSAVDRPDTQSPSPESTDNIAQPNTVWNSTSNFIKLYSSPFRDESDPDGLDNIWGTIDDGLAPGSCSPLIGKGSISNNNQALDISGQQRVRGINIDLGAYEYIAPASEFYVDANAINNGDGLSWLTAFNDLQEALCIADEGATIFVAGGTYYPQQKPINCDHCDTEQDKTFYLYKDVTLLGGYNPSTGMLDADNQETILSGDIDQNGLLDDGNAHHVITSSYLTSNTLIDGVHITHGNARIKSLVTINGFGFRRDYGGGINNFGRTSSPTVTNCKFSLNKAEDLGGAIMSTSGFPIFQFCHILDNQAYRGGGSAQTSGKVPLYHNCVFENNSATYLGGAMFNGFTSPKIHYSVFSNNSVTGPSDQGTPSGGAIFNFDSSPELFDCIFDHNSAEEGGAIGNSMFEESDGTRMKVFNSTFFANSAVKGGALHFDDGELRIENSVFWANTADVSTDIYIGPSGFINTQNNAGINGEGLESTTAFIALTTDPFINSIDPIGFDEQWATQDDGLIPREMGEIVDVGIFTNRTQPEDILGNDREAFGGLDLGAYEFNGELIAPIAICQDLIVVLDDNGTAIVTPEDIDGGSTGYRPLTPLINGQNFITFDCSDQGITTTATLTITDNLGVSVSCNANLTIEINGELPESWSSNDIGIVTIGNEYHFDPCDQGGAYTITGSGNNAISSTTDNVAFAHQQLCGNGMITAKIENITPNGYGGLMIREATAAGAKQASIFSNLSSVLRFETRYTTNGPKQVFSFFKPFPFWLRLERQGDWIFGYSSTNGLNFQYVHAVFLPMQECVEIGLASFTYLPNAQTDATFSNVSFTNATEILPINPTNIQIFGPSQDFTLYPNPNHGMFTIEFDQPLLAATNLKLYNQYGQLIHERLIHKGIQKIEWDDDNLPSGVYQLHMKRENMAPILKSLIITK